MFRTLILLSILFFMNFLAANAQNVKDLKSILRELKGIHAITFNFDSDLLENVPVNLNQQDLKDLKMALAYLNEATAFNFNLNNDNEVDIIPKYEGKNYVVKGILTDKTNKTELANSLVILKGTTQNSVVNEKGMFELPLNYKPNDTLLIRVVGYNAISKSIDELLKENKTEIDISKELQVQELKQVEVTSYVTQGISFDPLKNSLKVNYGNIQLLPGQSDGDVFYTLDALPGISNVDSKSGNLNVRGSTADQTLITYNEIPIYQRGHLFGTVSNINPGQIDDVEVNRNSFDSENGGRVGGLIKMNGNKELLSKSKGNVYASTMDVSANYALPVVKDKLTVTAGIRWSLPYSLGSQRLDQITKFLFVPSELNTPRYSPPTRTYLDYQIGYQNFNLGVIAKLNDKNTLELSGLASQDQIRSSQRLQSATPYIKNDDLLFYNRGISAVLNTKYSESLSSNTKVVLSDFEQDFQGETFTVTGNAKLGQNYARNVLNDYSFGYSLNKITSNKNKITLGYELRYYDVRYTEDIAIFRIDSNINRKIDNKALLNTLYGNYGLLQVEKFRLNIGTRINHFSKGDNISAEPRLSANYLIKEWLIAKSSVGHHKQYVSQLLAAGMETLDGVDAQIWTMADGDKVKIVSGTQASAGLLFNKNGWVVDVDAYYKYTTGLTTLYRTKIFDYNGYHNGTIDVKGIDVLLKKKIKDLTLWTSYTYTESEMNFPVVSKEPFPSLFFNNHVLDVSASYRYKNLRLAASFKYRSGLPILPGIRTPFTLGYNSQNDFFYTNPGVPVPLVRNQPGGNPPNTQNPSQTKYFEDYYTFDASAQYDIKAFQRYTVYLGASFVNILDNKAPIASLRSPSGTTDYKYLMGFNYNVVLGVKW